LIAIYPTKIVIFISQIKNKSMEKVKQNNEISETLITFTDVKSGKKVDLRMKPTDDGHFEISYDFGPNGSKDHEGTYIGFLSKFTEFMEVVQ
jgi:hypothetical protein